MTLHGPGHCTRSLVVSRDQHVWTLLNTPLASGRDDRFRLEFERPIEGVDLDNLHVRNCGPRREDAAFARLAAGARSLVRTQLIEPSLPSASQKLVPVQNKPGSSPSPGRPNRRPMPLLWPELAAGLLRREHARPAGACSLVSQAPSAPLPLR